MIAHSPAKIFLSDQRGLDETSRFRSYHTFNFGNYYNEHRHAVGDLYVLNDDSLAGGESLKMHVSEDSYIFLLPIVGAVSLFDSLGNQIVVNAGEVQVMHGGAGYNFELKNPFEKELINFLQIWVKAPKPASFILQPKTNLAIDANKNSFTLVSPRAGTTTKGTALRRARAQNRGTTKQSYPHIAIGKFSGRKDLVYQKKKYDHSLFVFIIEGAFETEGRLLHARDGLSLTGRESEIELEALSNDAIALIVELPLNPLANESVQGLNRR